MIDVCVADQNKIQFGRVEAKGLMIQFLQAVAALKETAIKQYLPFIRCYQMTGTGHR